MVPSGTIDVIEVSDLVKRYGQFTAVGGISFTVRRGEIFGILGPNGAGKTTTLEMIEGLRTPTAGTIHIDGLSVTTHTNDVKRRIGVQPQASTFFDGLTLRETLALFGALYGRTVDPEALLADVQLGEKAGSMVKELSGGQKQRFSIAVGLVNDPVVLFLDEPTTGLDPQARRNLWDLIRQVNARGTTVVLTTHYMDEAEVLCDRIAVMDHGAIVALDATDRLLAAHGGDAVIEFTSDHQIGDGVLAALADVRSVRQADGVHFVTTAQPRHTLDELFGAGRAHGFSIGALTLKRPTLEDVFLNLTGHQLRE
ncbi:MAG: ABC transporter ATP-binding protein [Candidatus Yanofskybacteria bacterium]|nr:ABC transporter ATP-binding protein [Candidatus Yanofskybacteria bacterium]